MRTFVALRKEKIYLGNLAEEVSQLRSQFDLKWEKQTQLLEAINLKLLNVTNLAVPPDLRSIDFRNDQVDTKVNSILRVVAKYYGIQARDLKESTRRKSIVLPRQIAIFLIRKQTGLSFMEIAQVFEKDHTTIIYACRKVEKAARDKLEIRKAIENISGCMG